MHKGFFADTLNRRPQLWQALLQASPSRKSTSQAVPLWHTELGPAAHSLQDWLLQRPLTSLQTSAADEKAEVPFWDYEEESRRLALLDMDALQRLCRMTGVALHAPDIAAVLLRDEVLPLREALGEPVYHYALYRGQYELGAVRRFFQGNSGMPLTERCAWHGNMALRLVSGLWPQELSLPFCQRLPVLPDGMTLPSLTEDESHELWRGLKKLLLKEVAPSWAPCFN